MTLLQQWFLVWISSWLALLVVTLGLAAWYCWIYSREDRP